MQPVLEVGLTRSPASMSWQVRVVNGFKFLLGRLG